MYRRLPTSVGDDLRTAEVVANIRRAGQFEFKYSGARAGTAITTERDGNAGHCRCTLCPSILSFLFSSERLCRGVRLMWSYAAACNHQRFLFCLLFVSEHR